MNKSLSYFMRDSAKAQEIVTVPGPDSIRDEEGHVVMLEIKVLGNKEIQEINDKYRTRKVALDGKGNPYISNGEVVFKTERDSVKASRHIIVEALQYPNLKDEGLMQFYGCVDITEMPLLVFPRADEYAHVQNQVMKALHIIDEPESDEKEIKDAKN